ncbi:MAG: hypothetical protein KAS21_03945 [Candidatus Aminicenantes bacterium]|nr:hypothetical protein [Candidatus Aminicenantes bacterium]
MAVLNRNKNRVDPEDFKNIDLSEIKTDMVDAKSKLINCYLLRNCTSQNFPMKLFLSSFEEDLIKKALKIAKGNQKVTSMILGIKATTLNEKMKRFQIKETKDYKFRVELSSLLEESYSAEKLHPQK